MGRPWQRHTAPAAAQVCRQEVMNNQPPVSNCFILIARCCNYIFTTCWVHCNQMQDDDRRGILNLVSKMSLQQFLTNCLKLYSQLRTMRFGSFQGCYGAFIITHIYMTVLNSTWWSKTVKKYFFFYSKCFFNIPNAFGCEVSHFPNCTVVNVTLCAHTPTRYHVKKSTNSDLFYSNVTHFSFSTRNVILLETKHSVFSLPPHLIHSLDKGHEIIYRKQLLPLLLKVGVQSQNTSLCPMIMWSIEIIWLYIFFYFINCII